jgi:acetate kinase
MSERAILVLNAGSSSIKFALFALRGDTLERRLRGKIDGIGTAHALLQVDDRDQRLQRTLGPGEGDNHRAATELLMGTLRTLLDGIEIAAVGHRVVHGGSRFTAPTALTETTLTTLEKLVPLAPLHQPHNVAVIRAAITALPEAVQIGCFDTAFHRSHEIVADLFALPWSMYSAGICRYGFHGLSYEYIAEALTERAPALAASRVVVAHLGNGSSLCALRNGRSVDSTMGFSALDGLPMGTRCGQLDPGVLLYLLREQGLNVEELEQLLYHRSGLYGISGRSGDMRDLLQAENDEPRARIAVDYFVFRAAREIAAQCAALGGIDGLVFTAGIGENAPVIRQRICEKLQWLGVHLDERANSSAREASCISMADSPVSVWMIPTNEELMIAKHTRSLLDDLPAIP